ncbi:Zinc-finger protein (ZIM) [Forsythia ovata]|uniref:Protein TIFY n=1 Tax=Forsythia ovata TaxID=205694 RepID=A0ABD1TMS6_9LAMI
MTIIYAGQVFVFNDFSVDKANEIMMLATAQNHHTTAVPLLYMVQSPAESTTNISVATPISNIVHGFDCLHYPQPSLGSVDKANEIMMLATAQNHLTTAVHPPYMVPSPAESTTNISVGTPISNIAHDFDCLHYPQPSLGSESKILQKHSLSRRMDSGKTWYAIGFFGGGAHDRMIINLIMLRYQLIAPEPVFDGSLFGSTPVEIKSGVGNKRREKKEYVRIKKSERTGASTRGTCTIPTATLSSTSTETSWTY